MPIDGVCFILVTAAATAVRMRALPRVGTIRVPLIPPQASHQLVHLQQ